MLSHNNKDLDNWFQRLNAPLRRLPADERRELHAEVRQHLEALAAANEELGSTPEEAWEHALKQFGDPRRFGKKMAQEWQQSRSGFGADTRVVLFGVGLNVIQFIGLWVMFFLWLQKYTLANESSSVPLIVDQVYGIGTDAIIYLAIGSKYPLRAITGAFYSDLLCRLCSLLLITLSQHSLVQPPALYSMITHYLLLMPLWLAGATFVAYLASVTKRGWYKPTWEDFKVTLPKRRVAG